MQNNSESVISTPSIPANTRNYSSEEEKKNTVLVSRTTSDDLEGGLLLDLRHT